MLEGNSKVAVVVWRRDEVVVMLAIVTATVLGDKVAAKFVVDSIVLELL